MKRPGVIALQGSIRRDDVGGGYRIHGDDARATGMPVVPRTARVQHRQVADLFLKTEKMRFRTKTHQNF